MWHNVSRQPLTLATDTLWTMPAEHPNPMPRGPAAAERGMGRFHPRGRQRGPAGGQVRSRAHALPSRAERLPAHRPREGCVDRLRHREGLRRPLQPAFRRHEPHEGGTGVCRRHHRGRALARRDWDDRICFRLRLFRSDVRVGHRPDQEGQGLRLRPLRRGG